MIGSLAKGLGISYLLKLERVGQLTQEARCEACNQVLHLSFRLLADGTLLVNRCQNVSLIAFQMCDEVSLPAADLVDGDFVEESVDASEDKGDHLIDSHGRILLLLDVFALRR